MKRWSVSAISEGHEPLQLLCGGRPLTQTAVGTMENVCPVEHLLLAVAGCFALSCRAVIAKRRLPRVRFEVRVSGDKAPAPSHLVPLQQPLDPSRVHDGGPVTEVTDHVPVVTDEHQRHTMRDLHLVE